MSRINRATAKRLLENGRFLYVTLGNETTYAINGAGAIPRKLGETLTQPTLFGECLTPQEDGLFPGFSQTWRT